MKPFSLLIKPASADCSLQCDYCFYIEKSSLYPGTLVHRMFDETLKSVIRSYLRTEQPQYAFAWQGGEPTLMGADFFRRVTDLQVKHARPGSSIANHLQTNAISIDDALAAHLAHYHFLVGISLDGPAELHDRYRTYSNGNGTHAQVLKGVRSLRHHRVETNVLTLVSRANADKAKTVFQYLTDQGFRYHQYIPCVEFDKKGRLMPYALTPQAWGEFLCAIFDEWIANGPEKISVRYFDSLLFYLVSGTYNICHMDHSCKQYFLVEYNGDVYPCDFFAEPDFKLGNACRNSWMELQDSPAYRRFYERKSAWHADCDRCAYLDVCSADCLKHRLTFGNHSPRQRSWLCDGYRMFFDHALEKLRDLAAEIRNRQIAMKPSAPNNLATGKIGRNQPCPCNSGKKYKKCCGLSK
jgi:serine-type anaerobic sulfatase-maturating enzyme